MIIASPATPASMEERAERASRRSILGWRLVLTCALSVLVFWPVYFSVGSALSHRDVFYHNDALFQADPPRVIRDLAGETAFGLRAGPHPLFPLFFNPIGKRIAAATGSTEIAAVWLTSFAGALTVVLAQVYFALRGMPLLPNILLSLLLGLSASNLVFGSLPDTFIYAAVVTQLTMIAVVWKRRSHFAVTALAVLSFGITCTNLAVTTLLFWMEPLRRYRRALFTAIPLALTIAMLLAFVQKEIFPASRTFLSADAYGGVTNYVADVKTPRAALRRLKEEVSHMFLYSILAPRLTVGQLRQEIDPHHLSVGRFPCPDFCRWAQRYDGRPEKPNDHLAELSFQNARALPRYSWPAAVGLLGWSTLLCLAALTVLRRRRAVDPLVWGLLSVLGFHLALHFVFGDDLFLYSAHWTFPLIAAVALVLKDHWTRRWFHALLVSIVISAIATNSTMLRHMLGAFQAGI